MLWGVLEEVFQRKFTPPLPSEPITQGSGLDPRGGNRLAVTGRLVTARDMSASATALCHAIGRVLGAPIAERTYQYSLIYEPGAEALPLLNTIPLRDHGDAQVLTVQEWIEAHYGEPIAAEGVARIVHMSPRNLRRRFLDATGKPLSTTSPRFGWRAPERFYSPPTRPSRRSPTALDTRTPPRSPRSSRSGTG